MTKDITLYILALFIKPSMDIISKEGVIIIIINPLVRYIISLIKGA